MHWRYDITGVDTVTLHFGERIDLALVNPIQQAAQALRQQLGARLLDLVPSYTSIMLRYNLLQDDLASLMADVTPLLNSLSTTTSSQLATNIIEIPVWYDLKVGPDLPLIAKLAGLTQTEVIQLHSSQT